MQGSALPVSGRSHGNSATMCCGVVEKQNRPFGYFTLINTRLFLLMQGRAARLPGFAFEFRHLGQDQWPSLDVQKQLKDVDGA